MIRPCWSIVQKLHTTVIYQKVLLNHMYNIHKSLIFVFMSFMLLVTMTQNVEALTPPAPGIELTETEAKCLSKTSDALAIGKLLSPKMQIFCGTLLENVKCNDGLELIFKSTDGSPACVKPKTAEKLIERGWASN